MRFPSFFYASPAMVRRWADYGIRGGHHPGLYFRSPNGRAHLFIPFGPRVESVYGRGEK